MIFGISLAFIPKNKYANKIMKTCNFSVMHS